MRENEILVAGFDPSFANFGMAHAFVDMDTLDIRGQNIELVTTESRSGKTVRKNSDDLRRAKEILKGMYRYAKVASIAIAEVPTGTQSARASWALGISVGVLAACPVPLIQVLPQQVKLATVGTKTASKEEMIEWAMLHHPDLPWLARKVKGEIVPTKANEHLADALAVIHTGVQTDQFAEATAMMRSMLSGAR